MKRLLLLITMALSLQVCADGFDKKEVAQLRTIITHNLKAMSDGSVQEYMKDIHPESPGYAATKNLMTRLLKLVDVEATLLNMKPLMIDEKYFIVRAKQKTVKVSGDVPYQNNIADAIHVYRRHHGKWLLWASTILEVEKIQ